MKKKLNKRILAAILSVSMCVGGGLSSFNVFAENTPEGIPSSSSGSDDTESSSSSSSSSDDTGSSSSSSSSSDDTGSSSSSSSSSDDTGSSSSSSSSSEETGSSSSSSGSSDDTENSSSSSSGSDGAGNSDGEGGNANTLEISSEENNNMDEPVYDYVSGESKWNVNAIDLAPTTEGILVDISHVTKEGYITYIIPEGFDELNININAVQDLMDLLEGTYMPGQRTPFEIRIVNNSAHNYGYTENSFVVTTEVYQKYYDLGWAHPSDAIGFDGQPIPIEYLTRRASNAAIQALYDSKSVSDALLQDGALGSKLVEAGYSNGIDDLSKYFLDFYNTEESEYTKLEDMPYSLLQKVLGGWVNRSDIFESNIEIAELGYNHFYNHVFVLTPIDSDYDGTVNSDEYDNYSIGGYMRSYQNGQDTPYEPYLLEAFGNITPAVDAYILHPFDLNMNGPSATNIYQNYNYGFTLGFQLSRTDTSYSVVHEYYTSTDGGEFVLDGSVPSTESVKANVGDVIEVANLETVPVYNNITYTYKSAEPADKMTIVSDPAENVVTLRYERTVTSTSSTPSSTPDDPYIPRPRPSSTPSEEVIPDESTPLVSPEEIVDEETPLSPPPAVTEEVTEEILEDEVPLVAPPKTGSAAGSALAILGAALGLGLVVTRKKK